MMTRSDGDERLNLSPIVSFKAAANMSRSWNNVWIGFYITHTQAADMKEMVGENYLLNPLDLSKIASQ
jgi:hypothetical protein